MLEKQCDTYLAELQSGLEEMCGILVCKYTALQQSDFTMKKVGILFDAENHS